MPILLSKKHPAYKIYKGYNVYTIDPYRAKHQDIRPLRVGILNLMPGIDKKETDLQVAGLLSNTALQIELIHLYPDSKPPKLPEDHHLKDDYGPFSKEKRYGFDGLIITGAPFGKVPFDKVHYWDELCYIMDWARENVASTLMYCWAAHAGLKHFYNIERRLLDEGLFGVFEHKVNREYGSPLMENLDDVFSVPHSRLNGIRKNEVLKTPELQILAESDGAGMHIIATTDNRVVFMQGHPEYTADRLDSEYQRNTKKWEKDGKEETEPQKPKNYSLETPRITWRANGQAFYDNWRNFIYQETRYRLIPPVKKAIYRIEDKLNISFPWNSKYPFATLNK
jgi:homoserine O-succinyltransferase